MKINYLVAMVAAVRVREEPVVVPCNNVTIPFKPSDSGKEGMNYTRVVPDTYGDMMLYTIIKQFAIETKTPDGKPSGKFYLDKEGTKMLADETAKKHLSPAEAEKAMKKFP